MDPKNILLLGVKGTVIAFRRDTGNQMWSTHLKSGGFVTVTADTLLVYAHTGGELFCLDLQTGSRIWHNGLPGLGYDVASLALPGAVATFDPAVEHKRRAEAAAHTAIHSSTSSH